MQKLILFCIITMLFGVPVTFTLDDLLPLNSPNLKHSIPPPRPQIKPFSPNIDFGIIRDQLAIYAANISENVARADIACYKATGVNNEKWRGKPVELATITQTEKCYLTCFFGELGMVSKNNKFMAHVLFNGFPRDLFRMNGRLARAINHIVTSCNKIVNSKKTYADCELGPAIVSCFQEYSAKLRGRKND